MELIRLNTLTGRVEQVLKEYPHTRDSDIELWAKLCELYHPPFEKSVHNYRDMASVLRNLPRLDDIARARRKVIEHHEYKKYLPTSWFVAAARKINADVWKAYALQEDMPMDEWHKHRVR